MLPTSIARRIWKAKVNQYGIKDMLVVDETLAVPDDINGTAKHFEITLKIKPSQGDRYSVAALASRIATDEWFITKNEWRDLYLTATYLVVNGVVRSGKFTDYDECLTTIHNMLMDNMTNKVSIMYSYHYKNPRG